jgi:ketosteroid isomerase-like protein
MTLTYDYTTSSGNLAVSSGHFSMTVEPKAGGAAQTMEGRFTSVAERKGGKWMYVSDHASMPMPPPASPPPGPTPATPPPPPPTPKP